MEAGPAGFLQEAFRGFLKCLGLEGGGGNAVDGGEAVAPLVPAASTTYEPLPSADDTPTNDSLVDALSSPIESTTRTTMNIDNNHEVKSNYTLLTIDEIINTSGGTTAETRYVELLDDGQPKMSLLTTSLISSGGGGKSH